MSRCGVVAVVGRPNVGKSTLVNRLVGSKISIVSKVPQTTRNRIAGICRHRDGQVVLLDTPGIHEPRHRMNRGMVDSAVGSLSGVDLIFLVIEATGIGPGDRRVIALLKADGPPVFLVINKIDLVSKPALLPLIDRASKTFAYREIFPVSAAEGDGTAALLDAAVSLLPEGPALYPDDQPTDQSERILAAELIREQILGHTREEVPQDAAVLVESWEEREDGLIRIEAVIYVARENQKGILIGREGSLLKKMGTAARLEIEKMLAARVFLKLWVQVVPGWREDAALLRRLGVV